MTSSLSNHRLQKMQSPLQEIGDDMKYNLFRCEQLLPPDSSTLDAILHVAWSIIDPLVAERVTTGARRRPKIHVQVLLRTSRCS